MKKLASLLMAGLLMAGTPAAFASTYIMRAPSEGLQPTPTPAPKNYAQWSSHTSSITLSNGNLTAASPSGAWNSVIANTGKSSGKWYWEVNGDYVQYVMFGAGPGLPSGSYIGDTSNQSDGVSLYGQSIEGYQSCGGYACTIGSEAGVSTGGVIGIGLDMDNHTITFYPNCGAGTTWSIPAGTWYPGLSMATGTSTPVQLTANFGQNAFKCAVPTGYNAGLWQ